MDTKDKLEFYRKRRFGRREERKDSLSEEAKLKTREFAGRRIKRSEMEE